MRNGDDAENDVVVVLEVGEELLEGGDHGGGEQARVQGIWGEKKPMAVLFAERIMYTERICLTTSGIFIHFFSIDWIRVNTASVWTSSFRDSGSLTWEAKPYRLRHRPQEWRAP